MSNKRNPTAYLELHSAVFLFGFTGILGKLITLDAGLLVWHRLWMTAVLMFIYVKIIGRFRILPWRDFLQIAMISLAIVFHWILFYGSIKLANVSVAMICLSSITFVEINTLPNFYFFKSGPDLQRLPINEFSESNRV
jgi:drug/metabolite transporter (DMT)-like permease